MERYGPFATYDDAMREWKARAWATVDYCLVRYRIIQDGTRGAAAVLSQ